MGIHKLDKMGKEVKAIVTFDSIGEINTKEASKFIVDILNWSDNQPSLGRAVKANFIPNKEKEWRVYFLVGNDIDELEVSYEEISDAKFMAIAEKKGQVHSLDGFVQEFNDDTLGIDSVNDVIRIIEVTTAKQGKIQEWSYSATTNTIWSDSDYGRVEAEDEGEALRLAKEKLTQDFNEMNRRLEGFSKVYINLDNVEVVKI